MYNVHLPLNRVTNLAHKFELKYLKGDLNQRCTWCILTSWTSKATVDRQYRKGFEKRWSVIAWHYHRTKPELDSKSWLETERDGRTSLQHPWPDGPTGRLPDLILTGKILYHWLPKGCLQIYLSSHSLATWKPFVGRSYLWAACQTARYKAI